MDTADPHPTTQLSHRALAMLRAIAEGRAHLSHAREPDLYIDGVPCCDQFSAHDLVHTGLVAPSRGGHFGQLTPAALTEAGTAALAGAGARRRSRATRATAA